MTPPPFKGGQGRSEEDTVVSAGVMCWLFLGAIGLAVVIVIAVNWVKQ